MEEKNEASPDWVRITLRMTPQQAVFVTGHLGRSGAGRPDGD
jgi:hypothetical protein